MTIYAKIDEKTFRDFSFYNAFIRQKRLVRVLTFLVSFLVFSLIAFFVAPDGALLGWVLLALALGLPAVYCLNYLLSVRRQAKLHKLSADKPAYTVTLVPGDTKGIRVTNPAGEKASFGWKTCAGAWRKPGCTYLYVSPQQAFLLPHACLEDASGDALWALLNKNLPAGRCHSK